MTDETFTALVVAMLVGAMLAVMLIAARRRRSLRRRFGPEYDRVLAETGSRRTARNELRRRLRRYQELDLRPLEAEEHSQYARRWAASQERFVEDPRGAVAEAGRLVVSLMAERGYPTDGNQRQRLADLSVEHGRTLDRFRAAHATKARVNAPTEELRQAMLDYRALFTELLGEPPRSPTPRTEADPRSNGSS